MGVHRLKHESWIANEYVVYMPSLATFPHLVTKKPAGKTGFVA
jgi:hypothetical protein